MTDNKKILIDTAIRLFQQKGYDNVSVSEIRQEAGLSNGTFYHYFKRKEDLLLAIFEENPIPCMLIEDMEEKALHPFEAMQQYYLDFARYFDNLGRHFAVEMFKVGYSPFADSRYARTHGITILEEFIQKAQKQGTITDRISAKNTSRYIEFFLRGLFTEWLIQDEETTLTSLVEEYVTPALEAFLTP